MTARYLRISYGPHAGELSFRGMAQGAHTTSSWTFLWYSSREPQVRQCYRRPGRTAHAGRFLSSEDLVAVSYVYPLYGDFMGRAWSYVVIPLIARHLAHTSYNTGDYFSREAVPSYKAPMVPFEQQPRCSRFQHRKGQFSGSRRTFCTVLPDYTGRD